jgi:hypothetical protein
MKGPQIFQEYRSHFQIPGARRVTWNGCAEDRVLEWFVNLTVMWHFLFDACEGIHIFVCKGENTNNCTEDTRCYHTKFRCLRFVHPHTLGPWVLNCVRFNF